MQKEKGNIIILNGVSSSGKTTIAKALQDNLEKNYLWIANDTFCDMCSSKHWDRDWTTACDLALQAMNYTIAQLSQNGINLIVDTIFLRDETPVSILEECVNLLCSHPVLFVRVDCELEELRKRELARGDRDVGQAEAQIARIHKHEIYDCTINTTINSTGSSVKSIINKLENPQSNSAFQLLFRRLKSTGTIYTEGTAGNGKTV